MTSSPEQGVWTLVTSLLCSSGFTGRTWIETSSDVGTEAGDRVRPLRSVVIGGCPITAESVSRHPGRAPTDHWTENVHRFHKLFEFSFGFTVPRA